MDINGSMAWYDEKKHTFLENKLQKVYVMGGISYKDSIKNFYDRYKIFYSFMDNGIHDSCDILVKKTKKTFDSIILDDIKSFIITKLSYHYKLYSKEYYQRINSIISNMKKFDNMIASDNEFFLKNILLSSITLIRR